MLLKYDQRSDKDMIELFFLGTGGTFPRKNRKTICIVARIKGRLIVFDAGEGCQVDFVPKFGTNKDTTILISHLHGDHVLGLPGLLFSFNLLERSKLLTIIGPKGIRRLISGFMRILHLDLTFPLKVIEIERAPTLLEVEDNKDFKIFAWKTRHTTSSLAYLLLEKKPRGRFNVEKAKRLGVPKGRLWKKLQNGYSVKVRGNIIHSQEILDNYYNGVKIVYSGDTKPDLSIIKFSMDADVLIHEASFLLKEYRKALESAHSTVYQVAELAEIARVKKLVLVHITPRYDTSIKKLLNEAKQVFSGEVLIAEDGDELRIK
ncbi:MAG TPA: ribonuclease Z [Thermoproteales archaeon]|nr:ribonuclease Z [Thermoproteales archaeon]